jgi:hypothetical protein
MVIKKIFAEGTGLVDMGQYVSLITIRRGADASQLATSTRAKIAQQLCQHVIAMRSDSLGTAFTADEVADRERRQQEMTKERVKQVVIGF